VWTRNNNQKFEPVMVDVIDVDTLADRVGTEFDVLNLDVEGLNWDIFQQFDWNKWKRVSVVCIEYDRHFHSIKTRLEDAGFNVVYASPENIIGIR
jgi:hypothetical protein